MKSGMEFEGKRIIVTGASSGIGRKTAIRLSELDAKLFLIARREEMLAEVVNELSGDGHAIYPADLSRIDTIETLVDSIVKEQGKLDGMVYSAGTSKNMPLMQCKPEKVKEIFEINFFGFVEIVRQICRKGRFNEGMRIVGVSSTASLRGMRGNTVYSASKAAMDGAVRSMAKEVVDKGICINTVAPGMTRTDMWDAFLKRYGEDSGSVKDMMHDQYLGLIETDDVAEAIIFLLSQRARFITGLALPLGGGKLT